MQTVSFVGQSARDDDNEQGNSGRLVNFYREPIMRGGKSSHALKSVLGMSAFTTIGGETPVLFIRDMKAIGGTLYVLANANFYTVDANGGQTLLGTVSSAEGAEIFGTRVLANTNVCIVSNGRYWVWDGTTLSEPSTASANFTSFGSGDFLQGYAILSEQNGQRFLWSDLGDATTLPAVNFATAESSDDNIIQVVALQGRVWLMKERTIERWYHTGQSGANAFSAVVGGTIDVGLKAKGLFTKFLGGAFFVGSDGIAYVTDGEGLTPVSTPAVETSIENSTPTHCFTYTDEGHKFSTIRFSDRPAWVYDYSTAEWHERAEGADLSPWSAQVSVEAFGNWYVGDVLGQMFKLSRTNADNGQALIRTAISNTLYVSGQRFRVPYLELIGRVGRADEAGFIEYLDTVMVVDELERLQVAWDDLVLEDDDYWDLGGQYRREPRVMVSVSKDNGQTWGREKTRDLGALGEYDQRVVMRALGQFRAATVKVEISDPADITLDAAVNVQVA